MIECSECGLIQLRNKSKKSFLAFVMFPKENSTSVTLMLLDEKLHDLHGIQCVNNNMSQWFEAIWMVMKLWKSSNCRSYCLLIHLIKT